MKIVFRRLRPGEPDWEMIWGFVLGFLALAGSVWLALRLPTPQCLIYHWSGWPCITCGATRAGRSLINGDILGALWWNPLVTAWIVLAGIFVVYAIVVCVWRLPRMRVEVISKRTGMGIRLMLVAVFASNWIYLVFRFSEISR